MINYDTETELDTIVRVLDQYGVTDSGTVAMQIRSALIQRRIYLLKQELPAIEDAMTAPKKLQEHDLRIDYYDNASGGDTFRVSCRICHIPTGKVGQSEPYRSRLQAKAQALDRLNENF